jgi:hypothetical protein
MNSGRTVFAQLLDHLPSYEFQKCVTRYRGDYQQKTFSCWDQYLSMAFAQLTYRDSLRDIEACLRSMQGKLYHMGFRGKVSRSTLADANESRDWRIYADFAQVLIGIARPLYAHDPMGVDLDHSLYALDSTTIDLCLSLFPWARFRQHKAAVKMHTLLDLHGNIPTFIRITDGKVHDVNILDEIVPEAGAFYVMDRGYIDFNRLYFFTSCSAFFVVRTKENVLLQRRYSHPVDKSTGVRSDHTVILTAIESVKVYPDALRRVSYLDAETNKRLKFLTNNFILPAATIAQTHKCRWQVELFFRMGQTASAHQVLFRYQRQRSEDSDLDCGLDLLKAEASPHPISHKKDEVSVLSAKLLYQLAESLHFPVAVCLCRPELNQPGNTDHPHIILMRTPIQPRRVARMLKGEIHRHWASLR